MDNINDFDKLISKNIEEISIQVDVLIPIYNKFFDIEKIFSSENSGKTKINRQVFNENHEQIKESVIKINLEIDEILLEIRQKLKQILSKFRNSESVQWTNLIFDDVNFLELFQIDLNSSVLPKDVKLQCIKEIKEILMIKNKIFNWGYYIDIFDTSVLDRYINKLGMEDLINSNIIFEIINSYALQFEFLKRFRREIKNSNKEVNEITELNNLSTLLELHKRRMDNFTYANVRYKISIDYTYNVFLSKPVKLNKAYLENILSCFLEQSCLDVVKKELKKGKIQKLIEVSITFHKKFLKIIVKNNGYEARSIEDLFDSNIDNKYILEAKNLANILNAKFDISIPENSEGMQYMLSIKLK